MRECNLILNMDSITLFVFLLCTLTAEVNCEGKWVMFFVGLFLSSLHLGDSQRSRIYLKTNNHVRQKGFKEKNKHKVIGSFSSRQKAQEYLICWKSKETVRSRCVIITSQNFHF